MYSCAFACIRFDPSLSCHVLVVPLRWSFAAAVACGTGCAIVAQIVIDADGFLWRLHFNFDG